MIIARVESRRLMASVCRAARPDEDVIPGVEGVEAARRGFPRALIVEARGPVRATRPWDGLAVPVLVVNGDLADAWDAARIAGDHDTPPEWTAYAASRIETWLARHAAGPSWVDASLRDLGRVAGRPLPPALRGMGRRALEYPARYPDLGALGGIGGLSAGALKARFRRRGLPSPYTYLRWFRCVAVAHVLSNRAVTTLEAADRVGVSSSGNLCRTVRDTTGFTLTQLRTDGGRERLLVAFALELLDPETLSAWESLSKVFLTVA